MWGDSLEQEPVAAGKTLGVIVLVFVAVVASAAIVMKATRGLMEGVSPAAARHSAVAHAPTVDERLDAIRGDLSEIKDLVARRGRMIEELRAVVVGRGR
jgi:hypothetical protein